MSSRPAVVVASLALLTGSAVPAAPGQDRRAIPTPGVERPGQSTKGQVWIENRGRAEAVPIAAPDPIPVVIRNPARRWEYQVLNITPGRTSADVAKMLMTLGDAGWETAGVQLTSGPNTLLVMKRPRPEPETRPDARPDGR